MAKSAKNSNTKQRPRKPRAGRGDRVRVDDIAALHPDEIVREYLPAARDELDAIVAAIAEATDAIIGATETIEAVTQDAEGEKGQKLLEATSRIYEACGFQDITGQRVGKAEKALKEIEKTTGALLKAFGGGIETASRRPRTKKKNDGPPRDADLLEGPQKEGEGTSQTEVDALLASFD